MNYAYRTQYVRKYTEKQLVISSKLAASKEDI